MKNIGITGTGYYVPNMVWTNHDLEKKLDTTDEWIYSKTGIKERRIADPCEATSDLALYAALDAIKDAGITPAEIDLIILATSSPDMLQPSTAAILQGKLGASRAAAFDISAVCAGFVFAVTVAAAMMRGLGYKNVLVVGAETYSRIMDWNDRNTCVFFGDGAGAAVLSQTDEAGYLDSFIMNNGRGWDVIKLPAGGSRIPATHDTIDKGLHAFTMQGKRVWDFATRVFPESIETVLSKAGLKTEDISLVISHQANINIIKASLKKLGIPFEKTYTTIEKYGNTSGASIPITLAEAAGKNLIKKGDVVAMVGFGGGLSWGAALFKWIK
ncbi:3-oxoacyl-[acyl-carrier-protein] synthase-3 [Anaerobacterium chartisolvens]|uniref:Beta-ketoacyl-[acyl-carrier-protein] synthase III n=1 Tax=Anaerobacterium chartisolvens TaxID=1297424 RepID=A0A369AMA0_9FIRM|nr:beta-ketoacyl-ACP synthase III [Anaerobacterium chartisolvens]RCX10510.1 3-oxoacyl-[acyl-carrier-protein] synthase-3 [Anaerobacterium chartisolvens]